LDVLLHLAARCSALVAGQLSDPTGALLAPREALGRGAARGALWRGRVGVARNAAPVIR
jgi:hypothetical protein